MVTRHPLNMTETSATPEQPTAGPAPRPGPVPEPGPSAEASPPPGSDATAEVPYAARYGLVRPIAGRNLAGVCAAIGRATGTDPVLWRVLLGVLTLAGGIGMLAYFVGWILIPSEGDTASPLEAMLGRGQSGTSPVIVLIVGAIVVLTVAFGLEDGHRSALIGTATIVAIAYRLARRGRLTGANTMFGPGVEASAGAQDPADPAQDPARTFPSGFFPPPQHLFAAGAGAAPMPTMTYAVPQPIKTGPLTPHGPYATRSPYAASLGYEYPYGQSGTDPVSPAYPGLVDSVVKPPLPRPRERSALSRVTISTLLLVLGIVAVVDLFGVRVSGAVYVATAILVIASGLLVGAWFGRAKRLIVLGLVLCLALAVTSSAQTWHRPHGTTQVWTPTTVEAIESSYVLDVGDATLDLRNVDFTGKTSTVEVMAKLGSVKIILPAMVDVDISGLVKVGKARIFSDEWSGFNSNRRSVRDLGKDGEGGGHLTINATVNMGDLEVHR